MNEPSIGRRPDACLPVPGQGRCARLTPGQGGGRDRSLAEVPQQSQLLCDLQKSRW